MTLGLLTITHDEPAGLARMLVSVHDLVDGPFLAYHIGDNEETYELLQAAGADVEWKQWDGFDGSWTQLFAKARGKADRFLYMQANHELVYDGDLGGLNPAPPSYMIRYRRGPYQYRLANLLRGDVQWSINAPVHGTLQPDFFNERQNLDAIVVQEHDDDGRRPEKIRRYLPICEQMVKDDPTPRAVFYLARTYFDVGRFEDAIEHYDWRIRMGGWDEEQWHAMYMRGVALIRLARFAEGRAALMAAYQFRPTRAEPLLAICRSMNPPDDLLFIEPEAYAP